MSAEPSDRITAQIEQSDSKKHTFLAWISASTWTLQKSEDAGKAESVLFQLDELIKCVSEKEEDFPVISYTLSENISNLYVLCLKVLRTRKPSIVYDTTITLSNVLCEETMTAETSKKSKKKTYTYSAVKLASTVVLTQLAVLFAEELSSLLPPLLPDILKNVKKTIEKEKNMHAAYLPCLMKLGAVILGSSPKIDHAIIGKLAKTIKNIMHDVVLDTQVYPISFIGLVIKSYGLLFKNDEFLSLQSSSNHLDTFKSKFMQNNYAYFGLLHDETRLDTSSCIAEVLYDWCFEKKTISMDDVLTFLADVFLTSDARSVKSGSFEALAHFIGLALVADGEFLAGEKYLRIMVKLTGLVFDNSKTKAQKLDIISSYLEYFENLHSIILPHVSEPSKLLILFAIYDCNEANSSDLLVDKEGEVHYSTLAFLQLSHRLMTELSSAFSSNSRHASTIKTVLLELSTSSNFQIRIHGSNVLKTFLHFAPIHLSDVLEKSFEALSKELLVTNFFSFPKVHGHTFVIANLIEISSTDYVPNELIMRILIFATSILKEHPVSSGLSAYFKQLVSWILLCGLMNYGDEDFLRTQSPQLFLFWNSVLTHTYNYRDEDELYKNVELRNHALACLLAYLGRIDISADIAKQVSFLLAKCTNFNNSIILKTKTIDNVLLQNENRILQIYLKIHEYVKHEFNSAILILIVKNFADPNLYSESTQSGSDSMRSKQESSSKATASNSYVLNPSVLLSDTSGFAYGLSSKVNGFTIDGLKASNCILSSQSLEPWAGESGFWYSCFEKEVYKPITSVLSYDCLILLYGHNGYSTREVYSPRVTTSIINSSMEVFSLIFPFLNDKIQYSVLESMNSCIFSKKTVSLRSIAIAINCCTAIHGALSIAQEHALAVEDSVASLLIKILKDIPINEDVILAKLKAECMGLVLAASSRNAAYNDTENEYITGAYEIIVKDICDHDEPYSRVFNALSVSCAQHFNSRRLKFAPALSLLESLVRDPHPIVHTWTLESISILISNIPTMDVSKASNLLLELESIYVSENYGKNSSSIWAVSYSSRFSSHRIIGKILVHLTQILGPEITRLSKSSVQAFKNLFYLLLESKDSIQELQGVLIAVNLAAFKLNGDLSGELAIPASSKFIGEALYISLGRRALLRSGRSSKVRLLEAYNESGVAASFQLLTQFVKLEMFHGLYRKLENLIWAYIALFPDSQPAKDFVLEWFEHTFTRDLSWTERLCKLFFVSKSELLALASRNTPFVSSEGGVGGVNLNEDTEEKDSYVENEEKAFTEESKAAVNFDSLSWETKLLIMTLLRKLFLNVKEERKLMNVLYVKMPQLIKVCFSASTVNVPDVRKAGIEILGLLITTYNNRSWAAGETYLEEEEAHFVSALMPAFESGSFPLIIPSALKVCAVYLCSSPTNSHPNSRISNLLVNSLTEIVEKPETWSVGEVKVSTKRSKTEVELSILDAWAHLANYAYKEKESKISELVKDYCETLAPLWIIHLREFVSLNNSTSIINKGKNLKVGREKDWRFSKYEKVWLSFANAIASVNIIDKSVISRCLNEDDLHSFVFVVAAQCLQQLTLDFEIRDIKSSTLTVLYRILLIEVPYEPFFNDGVHEEIEEIFERVVVTGNVEERTRLVDVIEVLVVGYLNQCSKQDHFFAEADKVYHLVRILLMLISSKLPFIRSESSEAVETSFEETELQLLRKCFSTAAKVISKFPVEFRTDLNACLLFIVGRVFESPSRNSLVPVVLPLLKTLVCLGEPSDVEKDLIVVFFESNKNTIFGQLSKDLAITTLSILENNGRDCFSDDDITSVVTLLYEGLQSDSTVAVVVRAYKSLVKKSGNSAECREIVRRFMLAVASEVDGAGGNPELLNVEALVDAVGAFSETCLQNDNFDSKAALSFSLHLLLSLSRKVPEKCGRIRDEVIRLIKSDPDSSKSAVKDNLVQDEKNSLMKLVSTQSQNDERIEGGIELRIFS